jgi:tRNA(fMet)-specific endonuclease VapC
VKYLLDTDICIELIRQRSPGLLQRVMALTPEDLGVSIVSVAELQCGVQRSREPERNQRALDLFLLPFALLDLDYEAAAHYGRIRAQLEAAGSPIGPYDLLIAAQALSRDLTLVTRNVREFARVAGLRVESWM